MTLIRKPYVAGRFYPAQKQELEKLINSFCSHQTYTKEDLNRKILGAVVPHAGYIYSGKHAAAFYQLLQELQNPPQTVVIINPNHTGHGTGFYNTCGFNSWQTPLGSIETDQELYDALQIPSYAEAHLYEHSAEVQLPFLQHFMPRKFKIAVITMNVQNNTAAQSLAQNIYQAAQKTQKSLLILASCDFSHFESPEKGFEKDQHLIDKIMLLDAPSLFHVVKQHQVSACGYGPVATLIYYALKASNMPQVALLKRGHSGEVSPSKEVVDYISMLFFEKIMQ
jgi:MEMO1 family protein